HFKNAKIKKTEILFFYKNTQKASKFKPKNHFSTENKNILKS
ncbi:hypothetical protein HMPREF3180_00296, partial [Leptotrichia wadei]